MRYIKVIILGIITLSMMGIGPFIGKNDKDDKIRASYMIMCLKEGRVIGAGSGTHFGLKGQKFILTAAHVIDACDDVALIEYTGEEISLDPVVVDETLDWAILKPEKDLPLKPAKFYRIDKPEMGMELDMVSWPSDYGMVYTKGSLAGTQYLSYYFQTFCWLGSSGASIFDQNGAFLGVLHGIKVGYYDPRMPPQLLNGICLVRPLASISDKEIHKALKNYDGGEARYINYR
tara:strand:- start:2680 stop:3375 length:696 start_codon:yes stop_codon:yes gene_type:complete